MPFTRSNNKAVVKRLGQEAGGRKHDQSTRRLSHRAGDIGGPWLYGTHQGMEQVDPRENEGALSEDGIGHWMKAIHIGQFVLDYEGFLFG